MVKRSPHLLHSLLRRTPSGDSRDSTTLELLFSQKGQTIQANLQKLFTKLDPFQVNQMSKDLLQCWDGHNPTPYLVVPNELTTTGGYHVKTFYVFALW